MKPVLCSVLLLVIWGTVRRNSAAPGPAVTKFGQDERLARLILFNPLLPEPCEVSDDSGTRFGTVHTPKACTNRGGTSLGSVAVRGGGAAVCCEFTATCDAQNNMIQVGQNVTTLTGDEPTCVYTIPRVSPVTLRKSILFNRQTAAVQKQDTCQLRLDFINFGYASPAQGEGCVEYLRIDGSSTVASGFSICGTYTDSIYLSYGDSESITLTFSTNSQTTHTVRVIRIGCDQRDVLVPEHCLQQFGLDSDTVTSFGYPGGMPLPASFTSTEEQSYTICVRTPSNAIGIMWEQCPDTDRKSEFFLSSYFANPEDNTTPDTFRRNNMPVTGSACDRTSYVQVHGEAKHCGARFNPNYDMQTSTLGVTSAAKPFMLYVNTKLDIPINFPTTQLVSFPYNPDAGSNPCDGMLGQPPHADGFEMMGNTGSTCMPVLAANQCNCMKKTVLPEPTMQTRTGFCLDYNVLYAPVRSG